MKKALTELHDSFDVRITPVDQDYVLDLAMLYESGVKLPPIDVTKDGMIVEGRHRYHAMLLAGLTEADVKEVSGSKTELIIMAMAANQGSKPMTARDVQYVIHQLLEQGMKELQIIHALQEKCGYTPELTRKHLFSIKSNQRLKKLMEATQLVLTKNLTPSVAAAKCGITEESLQKYMGKKIKQNSAAPASTLRRHDRTQRKRYGRIMADALEAYRDGNLTEQEMRSCVEYFHRMSEAWEKLADDYQNRFDAARKSFRSEDVRLSQMATA